MTITGGFDTDYPIDRLQTRQLSDVCKLAAAGPPKITCDFGTTQNIRFVGLLGIVEISDFIDDVSDITIEYSTNGSTWYTASSDLVVDRGVPSLAVNALMIPKKSGIDLTPPTTHPGVGIRARYVRITAAWVPLAGWRVFGRLYISDAIVFDSGMDDGWELDFDERGTLDDTDGGQFYEEKRDRTRVLRVACTDMDRLTAFGFGASDATAADIMSVQGMQLEAGCTGDIVVIPKYDTSDPSNGLWMRRLAMYGHIDASQRPTIRKQSGDFYATSFAVIEER
jgi:hypothetical protein